MEVPLYLRASLDDIHGFNFEEPIATLHLADSQDLSSAYLSAAQMLDAEGEMEAAKMRVYHFLAAVLGMHMKASERSKPFESMFINYAKEIRSAALDDFQGHVDLLSEFASRATHPVLKSRLGDVSWRLDRKQSKSALAAVVGYTETVERLEADHLKRQEVKAEPDSFDYVSCELLRRAFYITLEIGWDKPEAEKVRSTLSRLRARAVENCTPVPVASYSRLDLDFGIADPGQVASDIESVLTSGSTRDNIHLTVMLWSLAAIAFGKARNSLDKNRCTTAAAEAMVLEAEKFFHSQGGAMLAAHWMGNAIARLHGIPDSKERRKALRHRLIDMQAHIPDEMTTWSHPMDMGDVIEETKAVFSGKPLFDQLFILSEITRSPDPSELAQQAREILKETPLSSIFSTTFCDRDGKTIHRSQGGGKFGDVNDPALLQHVERFESLRRHQVAVQVDTVRQVIEIEHNLSEEALFVLMRNSPFVPAELAGTFSRGFARFFLGDMTSAAYILVPLLENSLRHVLKMHDHDVSKFDDATQVQEDRTISSLFEQMRDELNAVFGIHITSDIKRVFLDHPGPRLRNNIAHGLGHDGTPFSADAVYGCWLIFRLCLMPLYPHAEQLRHMLQGSYGFR